MTLGQYPALSLADAKDMYRNNMTLLAKGIDPLEHKEVEKQNELLNRLNTLTNELETLKSTKQEEEEVATDSNVLEAGLSYIIQKAHSGDDPREIIKYIEEQAQKLLIQKNEGKL